MIDVSILGYGNVSQHLEKAFANSDVVQIRQIYSRTYKGKNVVNELDLLARADVYIIAISDDAISEFSEKLPFSDRLVVHTSGSLALSAISSSNRRGVFYPLQTFSKSAAVNWTKIPICVEAETTDDLIVLKKLAASISGSVYEIDSAQRRALHVAAVFASNFTNHLYAIADDICGQYDIPFAILQPLILETASKIQHLSPKASQTGPALRGDQSTINAHLKLLNHPRQREIYELLTQSIQQYDKEL